jgi:carboxypeptidase Taq
VSLPHADLSVAALEVHRSTLGEGETDVPTATYDQFIERVKELQTSRAVEALLDWDQETYMPKRAAEDRADQMALIVGLSHEKLTADELGELLGRLEAEGDGDDFVAATNVREVRREYERAVKIPKPLVQEIAKTSTLAKDAWVQAREESDFPKFAPHLERLLDLKRQVADLIGWTTEPYDALMDEFEPGAKAAEVQEVFDRVKAELVPLVAAIKDAPRQPDKSIRQSRCPREDQAAFNRRIVQAMGLDFEAGRIDVSTHPFCTSMSPRDVRFTTRYDEHYLPMSLFGVMHEAGHALYEQGLDAAHTGTPMAQSVSLGIHESQSRLWENQVGRSRAFWQRFYPQLQETFPSLADVPLDDWHFVINTVEPSLIRVEADEVTYGLHIMLRFDLERKMLQKQIAVEDVPAAWNIGMKQLLGITPPNDAQGCLQDIHWSMGIFGYFPTYALGNLYAAQFFAAAKRAMPDLEKRIARGELLPLREWLRENIHRHGKRYRANELVKVVSGNELSHRPFIDYLHAKFKPLYGLG